MKLHAFNIRFLSSLFMSALALLLLQSCGDDPTRIDYSTVPPLPDTTQAVSDSTTEDGLKIYVIEEGSGAFEVVSRDQISILYTGRTAGGKIFDSTYANGFDNPRRFENLTPGQITVGNRRVGPLIDGFRRGMLGMKEGERRVLVIPPALGYGESGEEDNGSDLQGKTLIFDVELVAIL